MSSLSKILGSAALFGLMQLQSGIGSLAPEVSGLKMKPLTTIPTKVEDFDIKYDKASVMFFEGGSPWYMNTFRQLCLDSLNSTSKEVRLKALQKLDEVLIFQNNNISKYFKITKKEAELIIDTILKLLAGEKMLGIRDAAFKTLQNRRFIKLGVSFEEYIDEIVDVIDLDEDVQISTDDMSNINYHDISTDINTVFSNGNSYLISHTETNAQKLLNMHVVTFAHGYQKLLHKVKEQQIQKDSDADAE